MLPSEPEAAAALEEGRALARPMALNPTRRRTNYSPRTPDHTQSHRFMTIKAYSRHKKVAKSSPQLAKGRQHGLVVVAGQGLGTSRAG